MAPARPLRDVFNELTGAPAGAGGADPQGVLAAAGHPELPEDLVAEAVVSYADTAPAEVAEHLAPFVMAHAAVPPDPDAPAAVEQESWLDVLESAPDVLDGDPALAGFDVDAGDGGPDHDPFALDFGDGATDLDHGATDVHHGTDLGAVHHGAADFGGGATPASGHDDPAGNDAPGHPYAQASFDDLAALDGLDGLDRLDTAEPLDAGVVAPADHSDHSDHDAAGPDTVDGDSADAG